MRCRCAKGSSLDGSLKLELKKDGDKVRIQVENGEYTIMNDNDKLKINYRDDVHLHLGIAVIPRYSNVIMLKPTDI